MSMPLGTRWPRETTRLQAVGTWRSVSFSNRPSGDLSGVAISKKSCCVCLSILLGVTQIVVTRASLIRSAIDSISRWFSGIGERAGGTVRGCPGGDACPGGGDATSLNSIQQRARLRARRWAISVQHRVYLNRSAAASEICSRTNVASCLVRTVERFSRKIRRHSVRPRGACVARPPPAPRGRRNPYLKSQSTYHEQTSRQRFYIERRRKAGRQESQRQAGLRDGEERKKCNG